MEKWSGKKTGTIDDLFEKDAPQDGRLVASKFNFKAYEAFVIDPKSGTRELVLVFVPIS